MLHSMPLQIRQHPTSYGILQSLFHLLETDPKALILFPSKDATTASRLGVGRAAAAAADATSSTRDGGIAAAGSSSSSSSGSGADGSGGWTFVVLDGTWNEVSVNMYTDPPPERCTRTQQSTL